MKKAKEILKVFALFLACCAWVVGTIGGFGYALCSQAYFIGVCVLVTGVLAFPEVKTLVKKMSSYNVNAEKKEESSAEEVKKNN